MVEITPAEIARIKSGQMTNLLRSLLTKKLMNIIYLELP